MNDVGRKTCAFREDVIVKLYHPDGIYVWDTWYWADNGEAHLVHLQTARPGND